MKNNFRLKYSVFIATTFVTLFFLVKVFETLGHVSYANYGILPQNLSGLKGILFAPFIHGSWKHLLSNALPFWSLTVALFYFYPHRAWSVFLTIWFASGLIVWIIGRDAYHIGASGIIYGLTSFHFFSGLVSGKRESLALSLAVVFLYGSSIWGMLPSLAFDKSWEAHAAGYFVGFILALKTDREDKNGQKKSKPKNFYDFSLPDSTYPVDIEYEIKKSC